ncbi:YchJ family protein [Sulfurimonas sp. NW9]|uniref:YchJ family protein n=1 Tax=Sulfurimonas sp. NW9 TaxID=2922728 RepID=UPI003DA7ECBC
MTPKELMISRYEAFVKKDWEYLAHTSVSQTVEDLRHTPALEWLRLDVLQVTADTVEFKAYYKENDTLHVLHEKSFFVQEDGQWKYKDGTLYNSKIERNISCPCGSGKKYKKCCG